MGTRNKHARIFRSIFPLHVAGVSQGFKLVGKLACITDTLDLKGMTHWIMFSNVKGGCALDLNRIRSDLAVTQPRENRKVNA